MKLMNGVGLGQGEFFLGGDGVGGCETLLMLLFALRSKMFMFTDKIAFIMRNGNINGDRCPVNASGFCVDCKSQYSPSRRLASITSLLSFVLILWCSTVAAQNTISVSTDFHDGLAFKARRSVGVVTQTFPKAEKVIPIKRPDSLVISLEEYRLVESQHAEKQVGANAVQLQVGRNFEGNHLTDGTPSDNSIAISDGGLIVSVDNYTIAYFKENGDTITKFGLTLPGFYNDSTFNNDPVDPRVLYDRVADRFILVSMYHSYFFSDSRLLISFSKPLVGDTVEWNTYQIDCDSIYRAENERLYWFDFPNIAITQSKLVITAGIVSHDAQTAENNVISNVILEMTKTPGYNGDSALSIRDWKDVTTPEGVKKITIIPANEAFQSASYDSTALLVCNYGGIVNSTKYFWFELIGIPGIGGGQLVKHATPTSFFYSTPSYASQMGGLGKDRIRIVDSDIQSCILQNGKLHFVHTRSDNGWAQLVYANIDTSSNAFFAATFGGNGTSENCLLPSIASAGTDSTDENFIIPFLRTGPNLFPEVCVIQYDGGWSPLETVVKSGLGIIDLVADLQAPWDSLERWGDYTAIQRKYNDPLRRCWMVGAYPFGQAPNHFGEVNGVNAWIAEIGDSIPPQAIEDRDAKAVWQLSPNPIQQGQSLFAQVQAGFVGTLQLVDCMGRPVFHSPISTSQSELILPELASGVYFAWLKSKNGMSHGTKRVLVLP